MPGDELDEAFRTGDVDTIRTALGSPADFPNTNMGPGFGMCLVYAVYRSPVWLIGSLLDAGADPDADDGDGYPPLIAALSSGRSDAFEVVDLLLTRNADVFQRGVNDYTPLHLAAAQGDLAMVDLLLDHGAEPSAVTRIDDRQTPVEVASAAGHPEIVARLTPITERLDWEGASRSGDVAALKHMLAAGYAVDATDGNGRTALMRAAHAGHAHAAELLVASGADLERAAKYDLTALMLAVISGHGPIARSLVAAGADITHTGSGPFDGKTAADLAADRGDRHLAAHLRSGTTG